MHRVPRHGSVESGVDQVQQRVVIRAILAYLERHPSAADSAEGVARWWMAGSEEVVLMEEVEAALAVMVQRGLARLVQLADGTTLYARCKRGPMGPQGGVAVPVPGRRHRGNPGVDN